MPDTLKTKQKSHKNKPTYVNYSLDGFNRPNITKDEIKDLDKSTENIHFEAQDGRMEKVGQNLRTMWTW